MGRPKTTPEQFWSRFEKTDTCWLWTGALDDGGYGTLNYHGEQINAHKLAYILSKGPVPFRLEVMHSCHVRRCGNPNHLSVGTRKQNAEAASARGSMHRTGRPLYDKTHCPNGHAFTPENTYLVQGKYKKCKACKNISARIIRVEESLVSLAVTERS